MAKETYYFQHDYNARNDRKIAALITDYKSSGYGIFQAIVEMMHEEGDHLEYDELTFIAIAKDLNESPEYIKEVIESCIKKYKLFFIDEDTITSNRVKRNLDERVKKGNVKSEAGRLGGIRSGESRRKDNSSKQNEAVLQADEAHLEANEQKERKGKEIKEKVEEGAPPVISKAHIETSLVGRMKTIWKKSNPNYQDDETYDSPALLLLAYKIAKSKNWAQADVLNGKMEDCLATWERVVHFIRDSDFYRKLEISMIEKKWSGLHQTITATSQKAIQPKRMVI